MELQKWKQLKMNMSIEKTLFSYLYLLVTARDTLG